MELGIYTFGDITSDPNSGRMISVPERYAEVLAAAKLADEAGLDVFGVGEHHRLDKTDPSDQRCDNPVDPRSSPGL
jgi:alkanesulfonate monooxygenase SsuD/methylene tetrahydromethanopterin reductase-like flavin-dependent oxidoreductase (luciferase family)